MRVQGVDLGGEQCRRIFPVATRASVVTDVINFVHANVQRIRLEARRDFIQQLENNFIHLRHLRTPAQAIKICIRHHAQRCLAEFWMQLEQRLDALAERLVAEAVKFWNQPDAVAPGGGSERVRGFLRDKIFLPQLRVGLKFKAVIDLDDQRVCACRRERGQSLDEFLRLRIAVHPQMHAAPRAGNFHLLRRFCVPRGATGQQQNAQHAQRRGRTFFEVHAASLSGGILGRNLSGALGDFCYNSTIEVTTLGFYRDGMMQN